MYSEKVTNSHIELNIFIHQNRRDSSQANWDAYLKMESSRVHWFSTLNSLMVTETHAKMNKKLFWVEACSG